MDGSFGETGENRRHGWGYITPIPAFLTLGWDKTSRIPAGAKVVAKFKQIFF